MGLFQNLHRKLAISSLKKNLQALLEKPISEFMSGYVISIQKNEGVLHTADIMVGEKVSCVVVKDNDKPIAVITERDFLKKAPLNKKKLEKTKVNKLMSDNLVTVPPETTIREAIPILVKNNFRKLIIVDDGEMMGMVTQTDFVKLFNKFYESIKVKTPELPCLKEVMTKKVVTVTKKQRLSTAKKNMAKKNIGSIIVLDKKQIAGIITEFDFLLILVQEKDHGNKGKAQDYMHSPVIAVEDSDANVFEANKLMLENGVRRLPITKQDQLTGIVTQTDMCRSIFKYLDSLDEKLENDSDLKWSKLEQKELEKNLI